MVEKFPSPNFFPHAMDISEQQQQSQYPYHHEQPPSSSSYDASQSYEAYYAYQPQYYDPSSYPYQLYYDYSSAQAYPPPAEIHHLPEHQPPAASPAAAAAMAALSQLSRFAGDMDAAEKAGMTYNPHHYPQHYPMEHGHVSIQPGECLFCCYCAKLIRSKTMKILCYRTWKN